MRLALLCAVIAVGAAPSLVEAHKPTKTRFTYHEDVLPIFARRCGSCHREGGVAPMSLLEYQKTFPWAVSIKNQVLSLAMPPWFADGRYGSFQHSSSLTAAEVDTLVDWCLGGTPEGEPAPSPGSEPTSETKPDRVIEFPEEFVLAAGVAEARHEAVLATGFRKDEVIRSIEFRPEQPSVVRSALFYVVPKGKTAGVPAASWIAGEPALVWPDGSGVSVPAGATLLVRVHYKKTWLAEGMEIRDRSAVAFSLASKKAQPVENISVRPDSETPLSRDALVLSLLPLVEGRVDSLTAEALLPDGSARTLLRLENPDPGWPRTYWLEEPIRLPKGSRLRVASSGEESSVVVNAARD